MALFVYLALTRKVQRRDTLATLLWPESSQQSARAALRRELHTLNQLLGEEWLQITRDEISLHNDVDIWIDVEEFLRCSNGCAAHGQVADVPCRSCIAALTTALKLYTGDLLAGFTLSDCPEFDSWQSFETESMRRRVINVLGDLVRLHEMSSEYDAAIEYAHLWLSLEPVHEPVQRNLMRLLALSGRHAAAMRQYDEFLDILDEELGIAPETETTQLYEAIRTRQYPKKIREEFEEQRDTEIVALPSNSAFGKRSNALPTALPIDFALATKTSTSMHLPVVRKDLGEAPNNSVFYGRQTELAQLRQWIVADGCRLVAILGMGGMGKTSLAVQLVQKLTHSLHDDGMSSAQASVEDQDANFQYIIWRSLLNAPPLDEILPQWLQFVSDQQVTEIPPSLDQSLKLLLTYLSKQRCLLILDNVESILEGDEKLAGHYRSGYEDYSQLFRRLGESEHKSCVLLTSRESPLGIQRLAADIKRVRSLALPGLSPDVSQQFLVDRGLSNSGLLNYRLVERYSGNPLAIKLVTETIQDLFNGDIDLFLTEESVIFDDIRSVLDQQFARLSPLEREIIIWLMLEREAITANDILANLAQPPMRRAFLEALRSLQRRTLLITIHTEQSVKFTLQNVITEACVR